MRILMIFLDGFGLGSPGLHNPLTDAHMPFLASLLGGPLVWGTDCTTDRLVCKGIDACLGVEGIPQSATGQATLFTGENVARLLGCHLPAFPNRAIVDVLQRASILKQARDLGMSATFANAYTPDYFELVAQGKRRHSVTTHCVLAAGLPFRGLDELARGHAVYWDFTNEHLRKHGHPQIPALRPRTAGETLARLSSEHDLTLYECFMPDILGHRRNLELIAGFLTDFDDFLQGVVSALDHRTTMVLTSDHGNIEDLSVTSHTRNPVPLLAVGPDAGQFADVQCIVEVTPRILRAVQAGSTGSD